MAKRAFLLVGAGLTVQGDGSGGAVMQQAAGGASGQELGGSRRKTKADARGEEVDS